MSSHLDNMAAGKWYITDESILELQRERQTLMELYNATAVADVVRRRELLVELMGEVGDDVEVRSPVYVDYGSNVTIGTWVFVNYGCQLADVARITIGDSVQIGPNVQLLTPTHPLEPGRRRDRWETAGPITVSDNVWLGAGVIVCAGVTIGRDTVVGAGSVVTRDLQSGVLALGSPARVVRSLADPGTAEDEPPAAP
ncbi:MAG: maltose O-acetyltransferase [Nocardioidaceae bacterium]|jgi:maltose O-acetyltransferase|nr:maltose O-acetyltransferase [Nocardioidaceae bacterium]